MYPGSLPLKINGSVPGHEKLFNVRRCSMYTGVQFDRFHCTVCIKLYLVILLGNRYWMQLNAVHMKIVVLLKLAVRLCTA